MVGVPKSTGCAICRKRKIKCDETWPKCRNCRKNGKECPGPPDRHTFKESSLKAGSATVKLEEDLRPASSYNQRGTHFEQINMKQLESGAVMTKSRWKRGPHIPRKPPRGMQQTTCSRSPPPSPVNRQPSPSRQHALARALVEALVTGNPGHRMDAFGPFIREVPGRIGHSPALDAAVACLVKAHSSLVRKKHPNEIADPQLCLHAVSTLRTCLNDPHQGLSSNTLCASVLLGLVEALAGPRVGNRYLAHVGGAGRLLQLQGPSKTQDPFAKEILRFNRGGIIITSIYERKPCFLTEPDWQGIAFDKTGLSFDDCLYTDILRHMADFPALLRELKEVERNIPDFQQPSFRTQQVEQISIPNAGDIPGYDSEPWEMVDAFSESIPSPWSGHSNFETDLDFFTGPFSMVDPQLYPNARSNLMDKLYHLKDALYSLETHLRAKLADGTIVIITPSTEDNSPIQTAYHFFHWRVAVAYNCFWALSILANKVLMKLIPPFDHVTRYRLEAECRTVALDICKTWEDAWASKPIGAFHVGLSFVMAYEFCTPPVQEWILRGLNALLEHQSVSSFRWSEEMIRMMSDKLAGEGPDLVFSNSAK